MTDLNEDQQRIASTTDGIVVVDAGPGTGKTHTIVRRYMNILRKDVDPSDILLLTFTNNAAEEMGERVKSVMMMNDMDTGSVRSSTFDSFCMKVVMESPETVSNFFGSNGTLTRDARLVQNETLDQAYFRNVYTRFIRRWGKRYGNIPAIIGTSYGDVYDVIGRLMSLGIAPTREEEWFGRDTGVLTGIGDLISRLRNMKDEISQKYVKAKGLPPEEKCTEVTDDRIAEAVGDPRNMLISFIRDVYLEFVKSSIADNRLTFGLNALFAFIVLYENRHVRDLMSFRYVMIDEFQDTNELQFMTSLLILKEANLCVVGDWKQGIYGFRYATIENMTMFGDRLKEMRTFLNRKEKRVTDGRFNVKQLHLTENYRSTQLVIDTAFRALRCRANNDEVIDTNALDATVTGLKAVRDHGSTRVERISAMSKEKEISAILQKINEYVTDPAYRIIKYDADGIAEERRPEYGDIAVLCRTGKMCINVKNEADRYGIPAHLQGDIDIMATREGKLALAWLRYMNNRKDRRGLVTILADMGYSLAEMRSMFPKGDAETVPDEVDEQRRMLRRKRRRMTDLLTSVFDFHGLNNDITQSIISTISSAHSNSMLTVSDMIRMIESDMENGSRYNVDSLLDGRSVMIQTMHKSKGLEYPIVIIGGLNRDTMPLRDTPSRKRETTPITFDPLYGIRMTREYIIREGHHGIFDCWKWSMVKQAREQDWDGERRLFFVALSRAKQYITMTCTESRTSSFIKDIGGDAITETDAVLDATAVKATESALERPEIHSYERRRKRIPLHDIMGEYEESGGGKGTEFGIRIHKDAQRIMSGMRPGTENNETRYIGSIYDSVKNAKQIMTETDCSLPIRDIVITGRIDMLAVFDDRVEVHDFKTDMNRKNEPRYLVQLSAYAHAASCFGRPVVCVIDYVSQNLSVTVEKMSEDEIYERVKLITPE